MEILFLDDDRFPIDVSWINYPEGSVFTIVRTFEDFCKAVEENEYDGYSFDHDIADFHTLLPGDKKFVPPYGFIDQDIEEYMEYNGYHCAMFLIMNKDVTDKNIFIHTQNCRGLENIKRAFSKVGMYVRREG